MKADTLKWLLSCPDVSGISTLAAEIQGCGMMDLSDPLAQAIAVMVRETTLGVSPRPQPPSYHEGTARMYSTRIRGKRMAIVRGVALMQGRLSAGVGISEMRHQAVIYIRTRLPETIASAAAGRPMREIVESPIFRRGAYPIVSAVQNDHGVVIWFRTCPQVVPLEEVARRLLPH